MMTFLIQSTIIWTSLYLFYHFVLKKETFYNFNRIYLYFTLLSGLIIPFIEIKQSSGIEYERMFANLSPVVISASRDINPGIIQESGGSALALSGLGIGLIYSLGLLYFLIKFIQGLTVISRMYKNGDKNRFSQYVEIYSDEILVPFSFYKWIFFPKSIIDSPSYKSIRNHEIKHLEEHHSLDLFLFEIARILFWFNPLLVLIKRALEENHEFVADQAGLKVMDRKDYGKMLIDMKVSPHYLTFTNNFKNSIIKNRIIMMYKTKSKKQNHLKYMMVLPMLALFLLIFSCQQEDEVAKSELEEQTKKEFVKQEKESSPTDVFKVVEQMPRFPGCDDTEDREALEKCSNQKMMQYIFANLKYPEAARKGGVEGRVIASFVVDKEGMIKDISIKKDIGEGCGEEVTRVLQSMNEMEEKWIPGMQKGEKVKVEYTLPVVFKLSEK